MFTLCLILICNNITFVIKIWNFTVSNKALSKINFKPFYCDHRRTHKGRIFSKLKTELCTQDEKKRKKPQQFWSKTLQSTNALNKSRNHFFNTRIFLMCMKISEIKDKWKRNISRQTYYLSILDMTQWWRRQRNTHYRNSTVTQATRLIGIHPTWLIVFVHRGEFLDSWYKTGTGKSPRGVYRILNYVSITALNCEGLYPRCMAMESSILRMRFNMFDSYQTGLQRHAFLERVLSEGIGNTSKIYWIFEMLWKCLDYFKNFLKALRQVLYSRHTGHWTSDRV